jgi:hypothetical protein
MSEINNLFIGTWKLISWENDDSGNRVTYPYGKHPVGYLIYTANGYMAVQIMNRDRCQSNPDFPFEAAFRQTLPDKDRLMAYNTYLAYCGFYSYSTDEQMMTHQVEMGSIPGWSGKDQTRHLELKGGKLILSSKGSQLIWERAIDHV